MQLYRTGMVMDAIIQGDDSELKPVERLLYGMLCRVGPYRRAIRERWLFGRAATLELYREGFQNFLVVGAGLPRSGHTHQLVDKSCKVLYVDKDPDVVEEGTKLLAGFPNARYARADISEWDSSVRPLCDEFFGPSPRAGIIMVGLHGLLPAEVLGSLFKGMYEWAGEDSAVIVTNADLATINSRLSLRMRYNVVAIVYALTGNRLYLRSNDELLKLARPWKVEKAEPFWGWLPKEEAKSESVTIYWGFKLRK